MRFLQSWLFENSCKENSLFTLQSFQSLLPHLSLGAIKTLLHRAVTSQTLHHVCRGIYLTKSYRPDGLLLFHVAALLRGSNFNYISLETALSEAGVISQVPLNWITLMSSGRSNIISCGEFGTIEFVHTNQKPTDLAKELVYDTECGLWRASVKLAIRDMKRTHRDLSLINWESAHESI